MFQRPSSVRSKSCVLQHLKFPRINCASLNAFNNSLSLFLSLDHGRLLQLFSWKCTMYCVTRGIIRVVLGIVNRRNGKLLENSFCYAKCRIPRAPRCFQGSPRRGTAAMQIFLSVWTAWRVKVNRITRKHSEMLASRCSFLSSSGWTTWI